MKQPQPILTSQVKNVHFGETYESGYSTTTSSEEGTLQRKTNQACKANAELERKTSVGNMVSKGSAVDDVRSKKSAGKHHKKRAKNNYFNRGSSSSPSPSPYSSTSSLTQPIQQNSDVTSGGYVINLNDARARKPRQIQPLTRQGMTSVGDGRGFRHNGNRRQSHESLSQQSSFDEMTSSMEDLDVQASLRQTSNYNVINAEDDVIKTEALRKFRQSMEAVKSFQNGNDLCLQHGGIDPMRRGDYYSVGGAQDPYYDPLELSDGQYGQIKKQVVITTSPSISSGDISPLKPSPIRGILKNTKQSPQHVNQSTSSTPTSRNPPPSNLHLSKSEENLASIRRITPPGMPTSAMPLSPRGRKSAFVVVKPRAVNRPAFQDGPVVAVHPSVHEMAVHQGFDHHCDHHECPTQQSAKGVDNQALQMQVTPRNSVQFQPDPSMVQYHPIRAQLQNTQEMISQEYNLQYESECRVNGQNLHYLGNQGVNVSMGNGDVNSGNNESRSVVYIPAQIVEKGVVRPTPRMNAVAPQVRYSDVQQLPGKQCHHGCQVASADDVKQNDDVNNKRDSPLPPAETLSNEAVRLKQLLETSDPKELKQRLEALLKSKDPGSIHAMSKLFPSSEFTADAAHCVRCHKDFNPRDPGRCILPHPERMVAKISQDEIGADFVCGCCNAGFRLIKMDFYEESTNALLTGHCYSGMHTTDPDSVDYRIDGGSAKSCEEFGCVEFYV